MSRSVFGRRLSQFLDALKHENRDSVRRPTIRRFPAVESLEQRELLANITPSAVISSAPVGSSFVYTITLNNSSASNSGIGTFWYAWTPGQDYLSTSPSAVTPPAGWSDQVTHAGAGDGYAIEFTANSPANDVQPGGSLNFRFQTSETPASVNGNSIFYRGVPAGTSTVYPGAPFSDGGHGLVVMPASSAPSPSGTALVTVTTVGDRLKRHIVTQITINFSGPVNAAEAQNTGVYRLAIAGKRGSFTVKSAKVVKLRSAVYNAATDSVTLTPTRAFALTKPVQLVVEGSGLHDSEGRPIDGSNNGQSGSNAVALIARNGVTLYSRSPSPARRQPCSSKPRRPTSRSTVRIVPRRLRWARVS
jgi:hypothetical protein